MLRIIGAGVVSRSERADAACTHWRIAAGLHQRLSFLFGVDHRADDAVGAGIEYAHDVGRIVPGDARHRCRIAEADRLQQRHHIIDVERTVLHVESNAFEALRRINLGCE